MQTSDEINKNTFISARIGGLSRADVVEKMKHPEVVREFLFWTNPARDDGQLEDGHALWKAMDRVYSGAMTRDVSRSMNAEGNLWRVYVQQDSSLIDHMRRIVRGTSDGVMLKMQIPEIASMDVFLNQLGLDDLYTARVAEQNGQNPDGVVRVKALARIDLAIHNAQGKAAAAGGKKKRATPEELAELASVD